MDLPFTADERRFRDEVRNFLAEQLPRALADRVRRGLPLARADLAGWHAILNRRGWLAAGWPREWGGPGWSPTQRFIFEFEAALAHAPRVVPFGLHMLGPVLIAFGTEAQKRHWLPRILDGSDWWCQGYSEPGAGSDLAAVATTAVRQRDAAGEHYVVNGQKTWTTLAHFATMMFCLVRTSREGRKQAGISFLLVDMTAPGVEVRPIVSLNGDHEVNDVFLTGVRVPVANRVGEENDGWACAKYLLTHERTNIAGVGHAAAALEALRQLAAERPRSGLPLAEDPQFAARLARVEIALANMVTTTLRCIASVQAGAAPAAESSILKIRGTEIRQEIAALQRRAMGPLARMLDEAGGRTNLAAQDFGLRKLSIYGGSNEVQRDIVARSVLGL